MIKEGIAEQTSNNPTPQGTRGNTLHDSNPQMNHLANNSSNARMGRNNLIKSPSDTTIYAPGLEKTHS